MSRLRQGPVLAVALAIVLLPAAVACQCGTPGPTPSGAISAAPKGDSAPLDWNQQALKALLAGLPKSEVAHPLEALPGDLPWLAYSDDASAWLAFAEQREMYRAVKGTPLAEDLTTTGPWLALESLRYQVARVTSFAGGTNDSDALFKGPIAIAAKGLDAKRPAFVVVKRVDPEVQVLARFTAAFASLVAEDKGDPNQPPDPEADAVRPKVQTSEIAGVPVRTLERRGEKVSVALFQDLLIVGSDKELVERATALAKDAPLARPKTDGKGDIDDAPASKSAAGLLPAPGTPGVHLAHRLDDDGLLKVFGLTALGTSLTLDEAAPVVLRTRGGAEPGDGALTLLKYAPGTTFFALVDGRAPGENLFEEMRARVLGKRSKDPLKVGGVDVGAQLVQKLDDGVALFLGANDPAVEPGAPGAVVAFRHKDKAGLEPLARKVLEGLTSKTVERMVLEPLGGALLLTTPENGPSVALTDDALLLALSPDRLRAALLAGAGQGMSLKDRGLALDGKATQGVFVDLEKGAAFLHGFYEDAFQGSSDPAWVDVEPVLGPTFAAIAKGGALFGRIEPGKNGVSEGALRALK